MFEIIVGIGCGIVISFVSVLIIGKIANSDVSIINSLIPKSITTPMGISLANSLNGIESITVVAIIFTGIFGGMVASTVFKLGI